MPILVNTAVGDYGQVLQDLYDISGQDGGLGQGTSPLASYIGLSYEETNVGVFGADRLNDLINNMEGTVTITGGTPTTTILGYTLCQVQGVCGPLVGGLGGAVGVAYDTTDCNGEGYDVFDGMGSPIEEPGFVALFHELSHAYHLLIGDEAANPEVQAENDENELRADNGLPLRDPNNHMGLGCSDCGAGGAPPIPQCIIATAALGSPLAPEIQFLRHIRDGVLRTSRFGSQFFDEFWAQYYRFSPSVSRKMAAHDDLRNRIRTLAVRPLICFLRLVQEYVEGGWRRADFAGRIEADLRTFADGGPYSAADPEEILGNALRGVYLEWGLRVPLRMYWAAAGDLSRSGDAGRVGARLKRGIGRWLSAVPLPPAYRLLGDAEVRADLESLAASVFTDPAVRQRFERRLWRSRMALPGGASWPTESK